MNFREAIQFLYDLQWFGAKLGLENVCRLARLAGNPQHRLKFIHVGGTNGKGSVCALLESIYRASGRKVGLFTSPHLIHFGERIQVNRNPMPESDVVDGVARIQTILKAGTQQGWWPEWRAIKSGACGSRPPHPTFFEVVTVMALMYFEKAECDVVIWEVGMGGRLDATNLVSPLASVITNISCEHQRWLGDTPAKIAAEKSGIIKPGTPVVAGPLESEPRRVIQEVASSRNAPLTLLDSTAPVPEGMDLSCCPASWQRMNALLALETVRALQHLFPVTRQAAENGIQNCIWPGRFQVIRRADRTLVVDGAHNPAGARALMESLQACFPDCRAAWILGFSDDKDQASFLGTILPVARELNFIPISSARSADPDRVAKEIKGRHPNVPIRVFPSLEEALSATLPESLVVIAGSLYLAGEALEALSPSGPVSADHRLLNDWKMQGG